MAAEDIGAIYNTKIPSLADAADIQEAIKLYHYGSLTYNPNNENTALLQNPSIAYHLNEIQDEIDLINQSGIGSDYVAVEPTSPDDGFIWMDSNSSADQGVIYSTALYSNSQPTENLSDGMIWVDKDSPLKETFVWDAAQNDWIRVNDFETVVTTKGDILVGVGGASLDRLAVGTDGYVLTAKSSESSGLSWEQIDIQSLEISSIMGVY
jgi:hypothetical protein